MELHEKLFCAKPEKYMKEYMIATLIFELSLNK